MNPTTIEFIVAGLVSDGGEMLQVVGRCGGEMIRVGDRFDAIYRYRRAQSLDDYGAEPIRDVERPASLRVVAISGLDRPLSLLGQGMTGSLTIEGEGVEDVAPGWVLGLRGHATGPRAASAIHGTQGHDGAPRNLPASTPV